MKFRSSRLYLRGKKWLKQILSKIGVGSGLDTNALIEALVEADTVAQKKI